MQGHTRVKTQAADPAIARIQRPIRAEYALWHNLRRVVCVPVMLADVRTKMGIGQCAAERLDVVVFIQGRDTLAADLPTKPVALLCNDRFVILLDQRRRAAA